MVWGAAALLVLSFAIEAWDTGMLNPKQQLRGYVLRAGLQIGCLLWASFEATVYWRKMARRARLGIADPLVTNRFLLWALGAGAAGWGSLFGLVAEWVVGRPGLEIPWLTACLSALGSIAAAAMYLAFTPPRAYQRWIQARAEVPDRAWRSEPR